MANEKILTFDPKKVAIKIKEFIKSEVKKSGLNGGIVAVSGGIDSAVTLVLTVNSIGPENTTAITMPERDITPKNDITDVIKITEKLGVTCDLIELTPILHVMQNILPLYKKNQRTIFGNVKARTRMTIAYHYANVLNKIVIGSCNKTELVTGFFTKYGDGGVDIMPLADLYKTQLRKLARYLNLPKNILSKPPSPGFWPGQTDEDELGIEYETLDKILFALEQGFSYREITNLIDLDIQKINDVLKRVKENEHKRKFPVILRLS